MFGCWLRNDSRSTLGIQQKIDPFMIELYNIMTNIPSTVYMVLLAYIMNTSYITLFVSMASRGWIVEARFFATEYYQ